ncbi:DUF47 domain-containing protein [Patulibacter sp.]|uniref:DUF47 domain-containing protein n=1 Tax=Patulibacter sp. TaxID=1912859 RepID=UPI00271AF424|nr:DUF47 family protein [Patulibacter sp.]MDO9409535.1 DUF47 family protein [Patulibacter sp.]
MPAGPRAQTFDPAISELLLDFAGTIETSTRLLRDLVHTYPEGTALLEDLVAAEHEGDRIAHDLIHRLNGADRSRLRCPFDVEDGFRLATALDDVVDDAEAAGDMLAVYRVEAPTDQALQLVDILVLAARQVALALEALCDGEDMGPALVEINRLENDGDRISRDAIASLFEEGVDPLFVIRWKDIYGAFENAIDACETVAHHLEGIGLKRR